MAPIVIGLLPLGQRGTKEKDAVLQAKIDRLKTDWTLTEVPSFEVWCACTCYDPSATDGGEVFQAMMRWNLVDDGNQTLKVKTDTYYNLRTFPTPAKLDTKKKLHVPKTTHETEKAGAGMVGLQADRKRGFMLRNSAWETTAKGKTKPRFPNWVTMSTQPWGKAAWWRSAQMASPMKQAIGKCPMNSNMSRTFVAAKGQAPQKGKVGGGKSQEGVDTGTTQQYGCMSFGIRLAAYYGLYYYPGCQESMYNWVYKCEVNGEQ